MWERFTEGVKYAFSAARENALRRGDSHVQAEDILFGLCVETDNVSARVLEGMGVDTKRIVAQTECQASCDAAKRQSCEVQLSSCTVKIVKIADGLAAESELSYINSGHLLLAILDEGESAAAQMLRGVIVSTEEAPED